jgi:hypothetical protein
MAYLSYKGPVDLVLYQGEEKTEHAGLDVMVENTHTAVYSLYFNPDLPERAATTFVSVTLPDGHTVEGAVSFKKWGTLVFQLDNVYGKPPEDTCRNNA